MIRRLPRFALRLAVPGFCLLSLLAYVGVGWLWYGNHAEVAAFGRYARVGSSAGGLSPPVVSDWDGAWGLQCGAGDGGGGQKCDTVERLTGYSVYDEQARPWQRLGLWGHVGSCRWPAGPDERPSRRRGEAAVRFSFWSRPLPFRDVQGIPPGWAVCDFAFPPLLWLGVKTRRALVLRNRGGLGLCPNCGYDLRGCRESGRCSECGEAVPDGAKGAAA